MTPLSWEDIGVTDERDKAEARGIVATVQRAARREFAESIERYLTRLAATIDSADALVVLNRISTFVDAEGSK